MEIRVGDKVRVYSGQEFVGVVLEKGEGEQGPWLILDPVAMIQGGTPNRLESPASFSANMLKIVQAWEGPLPWEKENKIPKRHEGRYRI
jgi:hypothetical protein